MADSVYCLTCGAKKEKKNVEILSNGIVNPVFENTAESTDDSNVVNGNAIALDEAHSEASYISFILLLDA